MPWVVEFKGAPKFAPGCTYCRAAQADAHVEVTQLQATGATGRSVAFQETRVRFPACASCASRLVKAKLYGLLAIAAGAAYLVPASAITQRIPFPEALPSFLPTFLLVGGGIAAMAWRIRTLGVLRILHAGRDGTTFGLSREDRAKAFAEANGTTTAFKWIVVKA